MKRDLLSSATRALRAQHEGASERALETERRILSRVRQQGQRRARRLRWLLPAVAVLVASSAVASVGRLFPALSRLAESWLETPARAPRSDSGTSRSRTSPSPPAQGAPLATATAAAQPSLDPAAHRDPPREAAPNRPPKPSATSLPPTPAPSAEDLYRTAHQLHFVDKNPGAALAAWDLYLQAAPQGALALEARYNRALALVRLGRNAEAVTALQAFARGEYGPYRQAEAQALISKLAQ